MGTSNRAHYKVSAIEPTENINIFTKLWIMETKVNALAVELKRQGNVVELISTGDSHQMITSFKILTNTRSASLEFLIKNSRMNIRFVENNY